MYTLIGGWFILHSKLACRDLDPCPWTWLPKIQQSDLYKITVYAQSYLRWDIQASRSLIDRYCWGGALSSSWAWHRPCALILANLVAHPANQSVFIHSLGYAFLFFDSVLHSLFCLRVSGATDPRWSLHILRRGSSEKKKKERKDDQELESWFVCMHVRMYVCIV